MQRLARGGKYALTIWPYHAMLGGIGHALVPAVEEAIFFHGIARRSQPDFRVKGNNPLTEHYSILGPEVVDDQRGNAIGEKNRPLIEKLLSFDAVADRRPGEEPLRRLDDRRPADGDHGRRPTWPRRSICSRTAPRRGRARRRRLDRGREAAFERFAEAGMHVVRSSEPIETWLEPLSARV